MNYRYNKLEIFLKKNFRKIFPVQKSSYTKGKVKDICLIELTPESNLKNFFEKSISLLKKERKSNEIGDYLEFGVFNGNSMVAIKKAQGKFPEKSINNFFGFDAFEGLPEKSENEDGGVWEKGFYMCSFKDMKKCLENKNIDSNSIRWVRGWYENTLNKKTLEDEKILDAGIVFVDCDTYSSSKLVLDFIYPIINKSMIICFDDWKLNNLDIKNSGEYKAFNEFLDIHKNLRVKEIKSYNRKSKSFLVKKNTL